MGILALGKKYGDSAANIVVKGYNSPFKGVRDKIFETMRDEFPLWGDDLAKKQGLVGLSHASYGDPVQLSEDDVDVFFKKVEEKLDISIFTSDEKEVFEDLGKDGRREIFDDYIYAVAGPFAELPEEALTQQPMNG